MDFTAQPYPGLRPFLPSETDIFFGRERQTDVLLTKLEAKRFVAVLGASGCGKSSLVRAGLIPALQTGFMATAGARWDVVVMRPGAGPMASLTSALVQAPCMRLGKGDGASPELSVAAALRRGPRSLIELLREAGPSKGRNFCLVVDQFEETFRFNNEAILDEAQAFVDLLLCGASEREADFYVIITMRSDYLGKSSQLTGLPQAINDGLYLTPHLSRDEAAEAILGPAGVCGGDVDSGLVNRLLNDFGPGPDNLPLLQHVLMRMWHRAQETDGAEKVVLRAQDYENVGGMAGALSKHADAVMDELDDEQKRLARIMFQRLTTLDAGVDRRTPASVQAVADLARTDPSQVIMVADAFRCLDRGFITPLAGEALTPTTTLDIGHESLIRRWGTLQTWATEEAQNADLLRELARTAVHWEQDQKPFWLWRGPDLDRAQRWRDEVKPTRAWAERYGQAEHLPAVISFIEKSDEAEKARQKEAQASHAQQLRRAKLWTFSFALLAAILAAGYLAYYDLFLREHVALCNDIMRRRGVPQCVGELDEGAVRHRSLSARIIRKGHRGRIMQMEMVDSRGNRTPAHQVGTYINYADDGYDTARETTWRFQYEEGSRPGYPEGKVVRETALDRHGKIVYELVYEPGGTPQRRRAYYVGPDGFPKVPKRGPEVYFDVEYDREGNEDFIRYRTRDDTPIPARDKAFGQRREYDSQGRLVGMTSVDAKDKPMRDTFGNASLRMELDPWGNSIRETALDEGGAPILTKEGWAIRERAYDAFGRTTQEQFLGTDGNPIAEAHGYQRVTLGYDEHGNLRDRRYYSDDGKPTAHTQGCVGYKDEVDPSQIHFISRSTCLNELSQPMRDRDGVATYVYTPDAEGNNRSVAFLAADGNPTVNSKGYASSLREYDASGNLTSVSYLGVDGRLITMKDGYARVSMAYNRLRQETSRRYFDRDGNPTVPPALGYATVRCSYVGGRLAREAFFDADDNPALSHDGYASIEYVRNALGEAATQLTFGIDGTLVAGRDGYAVTNQEFSPAGLVTRQNHRSSSWQPFPSKDGVAEWHFRYDALGNATQVDFYGPDGKPTQDRNGLAGFRQSYDARGNRTSNENLDLKGRLANDPKGIARWIATFDARNNAISRTYYDSKGELALTPWSSDSDKPSPGGYARVEMDYDRANRLSDKRYFDAAGNPTLHPDGYWRSHEEYDSAGNDIETRYFGLKDERSSFRKKYHRVSRQYDRQGHITLHAFFDTRLEPTLSHENVAHIVKSYDDYGRLIESRAYGVHSEPVRASDGSHQVTYEYDDLGRETLRRHRDENLQPVNCKHGYYEERTTYTPSGEIAEIRRIGRDLGLAPPTSDQHPITKISYDPLSRPIEVRSFDRDGPPTARKTIAYKPFGETSEETWFDAKDRVVLWKLYEYDDHRRLTKVTSEKPQQPIFGVEEYRYNTRGALSWKIYSQRNGQRAVMTEGHRQCYAHRITYSREQGRVEQCYTHPPTSRELAAD